MKEGHSSEPIHDEGNEGCNNDLIIYNDPGVAEFTCRSVTDETLFELEVL